MSIGQRAGLGPLNNEFPPVRPVLADVESPPSNRKSLKSPDELTGLPDLRPPHPNPPPESTDWAPLREGIPVERVSDQILFDLDNHEQRQTE